MAYCKRNVHKIDFRQAKALLDENPDAVIVDVREEEEYITGHAVNAVLLPLDELTAERAAEALPDRSAPVLVYCRTGARSEEAACRLCAMGYTDVYDLGGLVGWPYGLE